MYCSTKFSTSASKYFNSTCRSTCLTKYLKLLRLYLRYSYLGTFRSTTCLTKYLKLLRLYLRYSYLRYRHVSLCLMASSPCPSAAAGGHGGEAIRQPASSRIPRRAVRGELRTVESQNSLRNRGLLYARATFFRITVYTIIYRLRTVTAQYLGSFS